MKTTLRAVNKALAAAGHKEVLVRGNGYFFFAEGEASGWSESGVYGVFRLGDMTVTEWVAARDEKAADAARFR
jgi:hypothetical protein